jgi:1-acyl-sn-glycerol-3-phosphate acyltransferase
VIYDLAYYLVRIIVRLFFRIEVEGWENLRDGACIVVSNHLSWTDTIFIAYALPRTPAIHTMASRATVFNTRFKRWLLPRLAVFPVTRAHGYLDEEAVNTVYRLLESGERVLIFPEGAYGRDGRLRPLKEGIGYFALNSGKPLLPIALSGTDRLRPFSRVRVVIGKPFIPEPPRLLDLKARVERAVAAVGEALTGLGRRPPGRRRRRRWWRVTRRPAGSGESGTPQAEAGAEEAQHPRVEGEQPQHDQRQPDQG